MKASGTIYLRDQPGGYLPVVSAGLDIEGTGDMNRREVKALIKWLQSIDSAMRQAQRESWAPAPLVNPLDTEIKR